MNIRNILLSVAAGALACSCNFSEDDCIRLGHLRAYCNFAEIEAKDIPVPTSRHLIAYGISDKTLELPEKKTFTQDTLKWDLPRGDYDFIFLSGNNEIRNMQSYRDCQLYSATRESEGKIYLSEKQTFVCKQLFREHFDYQKETVKEIIALPFTQTIILRLHVSGNINPLTGITSELDGVAVGKFLASNELSSEYATMTSDYIKEQEENNNCKEQVFAYQCNKTFPKSRRSKIFGPYNEATGATGDYIGAGAPTQALVDMYGMENGLPIDDPNSGYDPEHPFENREPRFYADIIYDGSVFTGHKFSLHPESAEELGLVPNEVDWFTGYFRRKGINENLSFADFETEGVNFSFFRYADVLLMYAEARIKAAELGGDPIDDTVIDAIDKIRMRPARSTDNGLPSLEITYRGRPSLDKLKEIIFNERIVELSFEFKAYTDVRRFRRGELLNQPKQAIRWDSNQGGYVLKTLSEGNFWDDKLYLIPIYQGWLEKNPAWMDPEKQVDGRTKGQNPGW